MIVDPTVVRRILGHLGLPTAPLGVLARHGLRPPASRTTAPPSTITSPTRCPDGP